MSIDLNDSIQALWFLAVPGGDWMAAINSNPDGTFTLKYRWRWYRDNKVWESADRKSWMEATGNDLQDGIEGVRSMIAMMETNLGAGPSYEILRGTGTVDQFFAQLSTLPFAHVKKFDSKEAAKAAGFEV